MHSEPHKSHRSGWLRAAVLGANDGLVSTASLIIGVASAGANSENILLAGTAGLVAGAMSMAAGEYVSVSSQADAERADLALEQQSLRDDFEHETRELKDIYQRRGLSPELAAQVAEALMKHDPLAAHARDDIGITDTARAKPVLAAFSSATMFAIGAALPMLIVWLAPTTHLVSSVALVCVVLLAFLGGMAAKIGGAPVLNGAVRIAFWGALAMAVTAVVGRLFGVVT